VYTFPSLTGELNVAKLVSDTVLPCATLLWPVALTLKVTFYSNANSSIQVQIASTSTDFFGGNFQLGSAVRSEPVNSFSPFFFSFQVPPGNARYNISFNISSSNIPFSSFCSGPLSLSSCNYDCIISGSIPNNTVWQWFELDSIGPGYYFASFEVSFINTQIQIVSNIVNSDGTVTTGGEITSGTSLTSFSTSSLTSGLSTTNPTLTTLSTSTSTSHSTSSTTSNNSTSGKIISTTTTGPYNNASKFSFAPLLLLAIVFLIV